MTEQQPSTTKETDSSEERETGFITTREAAERLGVTPRRVRQFIAAERLEAQKMGTQWIVYLPSVIVLQHTDRKPGRPPVEPTAATARMPADRGNGET